MPRAARVTMENACYHIITRGNQKQTVFAETADYKKYLCLLAKYRQRYRFKLYCFCLMINHVHMLMQVKDPAKLNKLMSGINLTYAQYFNDKYGRVGHVWQDRFKSRIIQNDAYLLDCITYIEANPVRAALVKNPGQYPWSSAWLKTEKNELLDSVFAF